MIVEQLYTACLSEAAYFIASEGEAAIVDPMRDVDVYLKMAADNNVSIKYIFETHFHADFVSGHLELAKRTGAAIIYGPGTEASFKFYKAEDGEEFRIGKLKINALHTPGHTIESTCYLLHDENGRPHSVFTGDTLFVGDVGRPDLFSGDMTKEELAGMLFDSLQTQIKTLPDNVIVYPAHGPGSACGKNIGKERQSTIGDQKEQNYAMKETEKDAFIKQVTTGLTPPPAYFPVNAGINKKGYEAMDSLMESSLQPLSIADLKAAVEKGAIIIDTRPSTEFTVSFIPESISIGADGRMAEWAGSLLPFNKPMILVATPGAEEDSVIRLARVGFENIIGYLEGGMQTWLDADEAIDMIIDIEPDEFAMDIPFDERMEIIDVRKPSEFEDAHVKAAVNIPLDTLNDILNIAMVDGDKNLYIHCGGGYRSVIAASLLKRQGFHNLRNVLGGFGEMKKYENIPIVHADKVK